MTQKYRDRNTTVDRALGILDLFSQEKTSITAIEVAQYLGSSRSTAYRYVDTLVRLGFLEDDPAGGFRIGRKIFELSHIGGTGNRTITLAKEWMIRLRSEFDETLTYTTRHSLTQTVIAAVEASQRLVRVDYSVGALMPIHAGAPSVVHLLEDSDETIETIMREVHELQFTEATAHSAADMRDKVLLLRSQGYYTSRGEKDAEAVSVGVPIYDPHRSRILGGLGIIAPVNRFSSAIEKRMATRLLEAAEDIRQSLAYRP